MQKKFSNEFRKLSSDTLNSIYDFKEQRVFKKKSINLEEGKKLIEPLPIESEKLEEVISDFEKRYLPYCTNDSSINNIGFSDSGNSNAGIIGTLYGELLHQNLINQSGSSPSLTFAEINVILWMREIIGYKNLDVKNIHNIYDVGGIITYGGTISNTIAMMLARENYKKETMKNGVKINDDYKVLIAENINHYSIRSSLMWLGLGDSIVTVKVDDKFRMDLKDLEDKLNYYKNRIMACVVYAGDSRTLTIDRLDEIFDIIKNHDENIWLHVDACHGFSLAFSEKLKHKLYGISRYDSITMDAHKALMIPYGLSILLTKNQTDFKKIKSESDLIMKEEFAFGQITPFIGSKNATSLKLWFILKNLGVKEIGKIIEKRVYVAKYFRDKILVDENFVVLNDTDINSVMFMIKNNNIDDLQSLNKYNDLIYSKIMSDGVYYLHHFPINIKEKKHSVLRFMSGNSYLDESDIDEFIYYLKRIISDVNKSYINKKGKDIEF